MLLSEVIPSRSLNHLYIYIDIAFLLFLAALLIVQRKYLTLIFGLLGGLLYFLVDYGIFYLALGTREVAGANTFWFLLWLSMSYGFTNFIWIWLWLSRDKRLLEWSLLILIGWFCIPLVAENFGGNADIQILRGTSSYHGVMAAIMLAGYAYLIVRNMLIAEREKRANILWILAIGIIVQLSWEAMLLITGIRAQGFQPLIINSLLETNLGLPYIFLIHTAVTRRYAEDLTRVKSLPVIFEEAATEG